MLAVETGWPLEYVMQLPASEITMLQAYFKVRAEYQRDETLAQKAEAGLGR